MNISRKFFLPFSLVAALAASAAAEPVNLEKHPIENVAIVAGKAVGITQRVGNVARTGVGVVGAAGEAAVKPFSKSGSNSTNPAAEESRTGNVNCESSRVDIRTLEEERRSKAAQLSRGAKTVSPGIAASRALQADYKSGEKVETAQYIFDIDQRISDIRLACGEL
jgi:hypothetical protein